MLAKHSLIEGHTLGEHIGIEIRGIIKYQQIACATEGWYFKPSSDATTEILELIQGCRIMIRKCEHRNKSTQR